jgi:hypothetical protein
VHALLSYASWHEDVSQIQQRFAIANNCLVDTVGLDWWQLLTPVFYQRALETVMLQRVATAISGAAEVCVTRPHMLASQLGNILGVRAHPFIAEPPSGISAKVRASVRALRTLRPAQVLQIAWDKWDTDYRLRRFLSRPPTLSGSGPRVLLPSAYRNVSGVLTAYASLLPQRNFLLVSTRADGILRNLPRHIDAVLLSAYASVPRNEATEREIQLLIARWYELREKLQHSGEALLIYAVDLFRDFERQLRHTLRIRDAWHSVLEREHIDSVLCGDENNPCTRLPVLLAKMRGVNTVYCSHGALDGNILIRGICSDTCLAKGEMEKDYLIGQCHVPEERISLGAPPEPAISAGLASPWSRDRPSILFFSEPYELYSGRTATFYREVLPALCTLARTHGRRVRVKLHPFESLAERSRLVDSVLDESQRKLVDVTTEPMSARLLQEIWFSVTVESSVAVECALAGLPSFLCGWFDLDLYCYGRQFEQFGAAIALRSPEEVLGIPERLLSRGPNHGVAQRLRQPLTAEQLDRILSGTEGKPATTVRGQGKSARPSRLIAP